YTHRVIRQLEHQVSLSASLTHRLALLEVELGTLARIVETLRNASAGGPGPDQPRSHPPDAAGGFPPPRAPARPRPHPPPGPPPAGTPGPRGPPAGPPAGRGGGGGGGPGRGSRAPGERRGGPTGPGRGSSPPAGPGGVFPARPGPCRPPTHSSGSRRSGPGS